MCAIEVKPHCPVCLKDLEKGRHIRCTIRSFVRRVYTRRDLALNIQRPWYVGHVYYDYMRDVSVSYVIPINLIVKVIWCLNKYWRWFIGGDSWIDKHIKERVRRAYNAHRFLSELRHQIIYGSLSEEQVITELKKFCQRKDF